MKMDNYMLTSGIGTAETSLTSFDAALIDAMLANYNIVKVTSILPARAKKLKKIELTEGSILFTAFATLSSDKMDNIVSAAVAVGIPVDGTKVGVIMEYSCYGSAVEAKKIVIKMVKEAMAIRGYEIKEILVEACEAVSDGKDIATAFARLAMW